MYKLLIVLRYLRRKLAPMFAVLAVTLCTAMVIVVISVMGGFLDLMKQTTRKLEGDVTIAGDVTGFGDYAALMAKLDAMPEVQAVAPVIQSFGLVNLPERVHPVEVLGIDPQRMDQVVAYRDTLYWPRQDIRAALREPPAAASLNADGRTEWEEYQLRFNRNDLEQLGMSLSLPTTRGTDPCIVLGIEISPFNQRDAKGRYSLVNNMTLGREVTLTVLPIAGGGAILEPVGRRMVVVNEFKSGLYEIDANRVFVPFDLLQRMLKMDAYPEVDPQTAQPTGRTVPARASMLLVRGKPGVPLASLRQAVERAKDAFTAEHPQVGRTLYVQTWMERHAQFIGAVEKEKGLVTFLFAFISLVAVVMIAVIFYMIVLEKTRDIGVLRAIGASRAGIMAVFLGYGLAIGIVGAALGWCLAASVVWNINEIQAFLTRSFGLTIWNPEVYYFDRVPSAMDPVEVTVILIAAVLSSVVGSLIPAFLAGRLNPVEALRYE